MNFYPEPDFAARDDGLPSNIPVSLDNTMVSSNKNQGGKVQSPRIIVPEASGIGRGSGRLKNRSEGGADSRDVRSPAAVAESDKASMKFNQDYANNKLDMQDDITSEEIDPDNDTDTPLAKSEDQDDYDGLAEVADNWQEENDINEVDIDK